MRNIVVASLILSAVSYGASNYIARKSGDMKRMAAGLPVERIVMPEIDRSVPQREVDDFNANDQVQPSKSRPGTLEPVDPYRREQMELAMDYDSVNEKLRHGVWVFPLLGLLLIVWRRMEEARIRRLMEMIEREKEVLGVPAPPA